MERYKLDLTDFLKSQNINLGHSEISIKPNLPELGIETRYNKRIPKEMATTYARIRIKTNLDIKQYSQRDLLNKVILDRC